MPAATLTPTLPVTLTGCSAIAVYAPVLFWMRALQVLVLMFAVPLLLACGRPVATVRAGLGGGARRRGGRGLGGSSWASA